ncbi:DUF3800 domain-containing protein [Kyrpidia sp.]|uniref:DUF3800 domain-containing protein n=1 Tax=Kyrpidia sp. TaxID=2073077 RepID=UPI002589433B|nr:DUF3800 domain-containing protein [Kyrpidia sp.]MCL6576674.1 hypothetical protein [Kyrpidia sp.]
MPLVTIWGDESCQNGHRYMVLGTIWQNPVCAADLERDIQNVKRQHRFDKEFHWTEMKGHQFEAYKGLVDVFLKYMSQGLLKFRALVVDQSDKKHKIYSSDEELHFYKMYFWLIYKRLTYRNRYDIFLDRKSNSVPGRLSDLKNALNNKLFNDYFHEIIGIGNANIVRRVEPRDGAQVELQLADVFAGAIAHVRNGHFNPNPGKNNAKSRLILYIQNQLEISLPDCHPPYSNPGFNIWCFRRK